jgi:hypothetical protein
LKKSEITFLIVALILAAAVGGLIGDIIGGVAPQGSKVKELLEKEIPIGFQTVSFDWFALSFTIGFLIRLNFFSILGMILVIIYFRWWYL